MFRKWIYDRFLGCPEALPYHLRNWKNTDRVRLHDDWPPLLNLIPRSWTATGPRAIGKPGFAPWPPMLVEGRSVTRWENSGSSSILWISAFEGIKITPKDVYDREHLAMEMNPGHPDFRKSKTVYFPPYRQATVVEIGTGQRDKWGAEIMETIVTPNDYSPSALQKFSFGSGYLKLSPLYIAKWDMLEKGEWPWADHQKYQSVSPTGKDLVFFRRDHFRPDHFDIYYNGNKSPTPAMVGFRWE